MQIMDLERNNHCISANIEKKHRYKVRLKPDSFDRDFSFIDKRVVLLISVGQDYHEGDKLASTIHKINKAGFAFCQVMVADTLQRHNYANNSHLAKSDGLQWINRNIRHIDSLECSYEIKRWNNLLSHSLYTETHQRIVDLYSNGFLKEAFNETALKFIDRNPSVDISNCISYLLEECPIIMNISAFSGYDYIAYPQPMSNAMRSVYNYFIKDTFKEKCQWLQIQFKKRKSR